MNLLKLIGITLRSVLTYITLTDWHDQLDMTIIMRKTSLRHTLMILACFCCFSLFFLMKSLGCTIISLRMNNAWVHMFNRTHATRSFVREFRYVNTWIKWASAQEVESASAVSYECEAKNYFFLFLIQDICCVYAKEPSLWDGSFEHPKYMLKWWVRKYLQLYAENFACLNRCCVFAKM